MKRSACAAREVAACRRVDVFLIKSAPAVLKRRQAALIFSFSVIYYFTEGDHLMAESKLRTLFLVILCVALLPLDVWAKRAAPQPVKPLISAIPYK